jgi:hypothetical protein
MNLENPRPWYTSKTILAQIVGLIAIIVPQSQALIQEYFMEAGSAWVAINLLLRLVTKDKLQIL